MPRAITPLLLSIFVSSLISGAASATVSSEAIVPIEKKSEHTALYREIFDRLATRHYRGQVIDDD